MKKVLAIVLGCVISFSAFSQKKELKKINKLIKSGKYGPANKQLQGLVKTVKGTEFESQLYFLQGKSLFGKNNKKNYPKAAKFFKKVLNAEAKVEEGAFSDKAISYLDIINGNFFSEINKAIKAKDYNKAGNVYNKFYNVYPERRDLLINTLYSYQEAKNVEKQIQVTQKLLKLDKGKKSFNAINKKTKAVNEFFKKGPRDLGVKNKTHIDAKDVKIEAKTRINYYNILVRLFSDAGKDNKALEVLKKAKKEYPKKAKFFEDYATITLKKGDKQGYVKAAMEALTLKPENKGLWLNVGIVNQELKNKIAAIQAYNKVIEIDPNYAGAYTNKGILILSEEQAIVDELNNNLRNKAKHAEVSKKLNTMYVKAIDAFENSYKLKPAEGIKSALINLYNATNQKDKIAGLK